MENWLARSWLFEIADSETNEIEQSFTLVLPPRSYTIRERGRVSITKTFGNAFIDDYGPDNIEITIKGISGTAHAFPTFKTTGGLTGGKYYAGRVATDIELSGSATQGYDGRGAFYTFRNEIMRYRDLEGYDRKELRVYDLYDEQSYKCILMEFSVDRNADKPFWYPFTIQLFVYARLDSKKAAKPKKIKASKDPFTMIDAMNGALAWFDEVAKIHQTIMNAVSTFTTAIDLASSRLSTFASQLRSIAESPLNIAKQLIDAAVTLGETVRNLYDQGKLTVESYANFQEVADSSIRDALSLFMFSVEQGGGQVREEQLLYDDGVDTSSTTIDRKTVVDKLQFEGVRIYTVKARDTLQSIALNELGDDTLWPYIPMLNPGIYSNSDLVVGEEIWLPVLGDVGESSQFIVSDDPLHNPYGADIKLDPDGKMIVIESNDVALIDGLENVEQAIDLRLNTPAGSIIKQTAFGLSAQPGDAGSAEAIAYIRMSVSSALIKDPRIYSTSNMIVTVDEGDISISMDVGVIGYDKTLPVSVTF